jgi:chromosome segregation ATPase
VQDVLLSFLQIALPVVGMLVAGYFTYKANQEKGRLEREIAERRLEHDALLAQRGQEQEEQEEQEERERTQRETELAQLRELREWLAKEVHRLREELADCYEKHEDITSLKTENRILEYKRGALQQMLEAQQAVLEEEKRQVAEFTKVLADTAAQIAEKEQTITALREKRSEHWLSLQQKSAEVDQLRHRLNWYEDGWLDTKPLGPLFPREDNGEEVEETGEGEQHE